MLEIKPFTSNDYQAIADIENSVFTDEFFVANSFIEADERRPEHIKQGRFVAWLEQQAVAYGEYGQDVGQYHPQRFRLFVTVRPEYQRQGIGSSLWETLNQAIAEFNPIGMVSNTREDMLGLEFLKKRGFTEKMRTWENRIDVTNFDATPYQHLRTELERQNIELLSLEQILAQENAAREYYQLNIEVGRDVPRAYPMTERSFEDFSKWNLENPKVLKVGTFLAVQNGALIGLSQLFKSDGDYLTIGLTGVRREARGKHIALALKVACLEWAQQNNYPEIRTWNDSNNLPILALNTKLGFKQCPAWIECVKELKGEQL
jgi:mycothiol synthase